MKKYLYLILFFLVCVPAIAGTINSYTLKSPPDDADTIVIYDSDDGSTKKIEVGDISETINWDSIDNEIQNSSINWSSVINQEIQYQGVNWSSTNIFTNGMHGNIGIGTSNPQSLLDINGLIKVTSDKIALKPTTTYTVCATDARGKDACDYTCDGTADDVQIQAAITAATALPYGGKVHLSEGHFNIATSIIPEPNVWLEGSGMNQTWLLGQSSLANTAIIQDSTTYTAVAPLSGFMVTNMAFDGTSMTRTGYSTGRKAIFIKYVSKNIYRDLYMYNTPATCMGVDFFYDGIIDHVIVDSCGTAGQGTNGGSNGLGIGTIGSSGAEDEILFVVNNEAKNVANRGIMLEEQSGANSPRHIIMSNNMSVGNTDGFSISGTKRITFSGNQSWDNSQYGLVLDDTGGFGSVDPTEIIISNNSFIDNTSDGINFASGMEDSVNISLIGNTSYSNGGYGMLLKGNHLLVLNNNVGTNDLTGIFINVGVTSNDIDIKGNNIHNNGILGTVGSNDGLKINVANSATLTGVNISGNTIIDSQGSPTQRYGVYLTTSTGTLNTVSLLNNVIYGNANGDILNDNVSSSQITSIIPKSGNIGIGTFTPLNSFHVQGESYFAGNVGIGTVSPGTGLVLGSGVNFQTVGIGTTVPQLPCIKANRQWGYYDGVWNGTCN